MVGCALGGRDLLLRSRGLLSFTSECGVDCEQFAMSLVKFEPYCGSYGHVGLVPWLIAWFDVGCRSFFFARNSCGHAELIEPNRL